MKRELSNITFNSSDHSHIQSRPRRVHRQGWRSRGKADGMPIHRRLKAARGTDAAHYSPVSNIGDIRSLEEGSDEGSIVLDADEVGLDTFLEQFV